jgi:hypothetical protein
MKGIYTVVFVLDEVLLRSPMADFAEPRVNGPFRDPLEHRVYSPRVSLAPTRQRRREIDLSQQGFIINGRLFGDDDDWRES